MNESVEESKNKYIPFDARYWADMWFETIREHPDVPFDYDSMVSWFANAIMTGYDEGCGYGKKIAKEQLLKVVGDIDTVWPI